MTNRCVKVTKLMNNMTLLYMKPIQIHCYESEKNSAFMYSDLVQALSGDNWFNPAQ